MLKLIGKGNTATVYEWDEGKVLKLFHSKYSPQFVEREFNNATTVNNMPFLSPNSHEMIRYNNQLGIVYDLVEGESLLDWILRTQDVEGCALLMAELHKLILQNKANKLSNYKTFLKTHLKKAEKLSSERKEACLKILEHLPDDDDLCHGDFHPGNIIMSTEGPVVIDFMNLCQGPFLFDIARTVYLMEYTPIPDEFDRTEGLKLQKKLADRYLELMNVSRDELHDYLLVIDAARKGECPDE